MNVRSLMLTAMVMAALSIPDYVLAENASQDLVVRNHQFDPGELVIPAGVEVKLVVHNNEAIPIEFESYDLSREIVVPVHGQRTIYIGPLKPGKYSFFNDFNHDMTGTVIAKAGLKKGG